MGPRRSDPVTLGIVRNDRVHKATLKLGAIENDKPVRVTIDLPVALHRDLVAYAQALSSEAAQNAVDHAKLIAPMATDRAFAKLRRGSQTFAASKG
jgi:hypothetical protein